MKASMVRSMACYRPAGKDVCIPGAVPELSPFASIGTEGHAYLPLHLPQPETLSSRSAGWVGGERRDVETWCAPPGIILRVAGGGDFYIAPDGGHIVPVEVGAEPRGEASSAAITELDREILAGPALVLALAMRGTWCLHASAVMYGGEAIAFLGESGQGKSTLAAFLSLSAGWRLVADDILPVRIDPGGVWALPHFPQLKLPMNSQPGLGHAEKLPLSGICLLMSAEGDPELDQLPANKAARVWLSHTAGTRLFGPGLLAKHLEFCTQAPGRLPVYRLAYPRQRDALPRIKELLEGIC